jgi:7-cyano-7-deazaguanine synthase in queuosine biosynthesis
MTGAGAPRQIWFRAAGVPLAEASADPFVPAALVPAMRLGLPLHVEGSVSARLLRGTVRYQEILNAWYPELRVVPVTAAAAAGAGAAAPARAIAFFTGGVDSSYTVRKHRDHIHDLVFVHGFDVPLGDIELRRLVATRLREAASWLSKPLIEVETNVRESTSDLAAWQGQYHGAALAAVALALAPSCTTAYIASTRPYRNLIPMGSHYILDPLWSTETLELVHDGCEYDRFRKVAALAEDGEALRWLRVCWQNPGGAYNCGTCSKCLRTMTYLRAVGALERCATFARPLDLRGLRSMDVRTGLRFDLEQALEHAEARGKDPALVRELSRILAARPRPRWVRTARAALSALRARVRP